MGLGVGVRCWAECLTKQNPDREGGLRFQVDYETSGFLLALSLTVGVLLVAHPKLHGV